MSHARIPYFSQPSDAQRQRPHRPSPSLGRWPLPQPAERSPPVRRQALAGRRPVRPDTAHSRAPRFLDVTGEFLTAVVLIAGGVFAYGPADQLVYE